jgi:hypothetical protein
VVLAAPLATAVKADDIIIKERTDRDKAVVKPPGADADVVLKERAAPPRRDNDKVIIKEK